MGDLGAVGFLGVRLLIWIFFGMSVLCGLIVLTYWKREVIKEKYYKIRFPEKVIKIILHYKGTTKFRTFWRLIPDKRDFSLNGKRYLYDDKQILKENDFYIYEKDKMLVARIEGIEYNLDDKYRINKSRRDNWPEIHYFSDCPFAISFNDYLQTLNQDPKDPKNSKAVIMVSAKDYQTLSEGDMWDKLLTLRGEKASFMILMILGIGNLLIGLFTLAKMMGWIK
jgi:hypothetical protein